MPVQRLDPDHLAFELAKVTDRRDPPVPVWAWLLLDSREWRGELLGWASNPNGADDGLRGLVRITREFAPGFFAEGVHWVRADHLRERRGG